MTTHLPFEDETAGVPAAPPVVPAPLFADERTGTPGGAQRPVTCPECGQPAVVSMNRRQAADFCPRCDYPLFWTPSEVVMDPRGGGESLKRLPGAVGRQNMGSLPCPHCAERNMITAELCVRCGGAMRLAPPEPPRIAAPPPAPVVVEPEPEPERDQFWIWVSIAIGVGLAVLLALLLFQAFS